MLDTALILALGFLGQDIDGSWRFQLIQSPNPRYADVAVARNGRENPPYDLTQPLSLLWTVVTAVSARTHPGLRWECQGKDATNFVGSGFKARGTMDMQSKNHRFLR
ncbi:hypothetical protein PMIN06_010807 [Paraphaeosphaeria minitans]|uniref:Uncharacterized protein n=1 Tax=Paraphaeosphaeria minitans TaxID=565426 RepID=A0A9P6GDD9_9PLEO|nr:hypothetical protein PMIN01_08010 [Paraphaeosphaeria minitans]